MSLIFTNVRGMLYGYFNTIFISFVKHITTWQVSLNKVIASVCAPNKPFQTIFHKKDVVLSKEVILFDF